MPLVGGGLRPLGCREASDGPLIVISWVKVIWKQKRIQDDLHQVSSDLVKARTTTYKITVTPANQYCRTPKTI